MSKVYLKNTHSMSKTENCDNTFSLTINFLELAFDVDSLRLVDAFGFIPLVNAKETKLNLPSCSTGNYYIRLNNRNVKKGEVYSYNDKAYTEGEGFESYSIYYDIGKKMICIGEVGYSSNAIMVNDNIVCVIDPKGILRCIYFILDRIE